MPRIIRDVNLQEKDTEAVGRIIANIKSKPRYQNIPNETIDSLITLYCTLNRIYPVNKKKLTGDEVLEWMDQYDDFGLLLFEATDELKDEKLPPLSATHIYNLMNELDPNFIEACYKYARKYKYIDKNNIENIPDNHEEGAGKPVDFKELCTMLFLDTNLDGQDKLVPRLYRETVKNLEHIYFNEPVERFPEYITEADDEEVDDDEEIVDNKSQETDAEVDTADDESEEDQQVEANVDFVDDEPKAGDSIDIIPAEEASNPEVEMNQQAMLSCVNDLLKDGWSIVDKANGMIATVTYDYKGKNKEDILKILNEYVDDTLIQIGMLSKVSELIDSKKSQLMSDGQEKAEEIIQK